jgi:O-antigen ligase
VLSLVGYPIVAAASVIMGLPNRPLSIGLRGFILALALATAIRVLVRARMEWDRPFWIAWWAFWIAYLSRMAFDTLAGVDARNYPAFEYASFAIGTCLIPALALANPRLGASVSGASLLVIRLAMLGLLANGWAILFEGSLLQFVQVALLRLESETLNPIAIGHLGVTLFLLCLWHLVVAGEQGAWRRAYLGLGMVLGIVALAASGSRGPAVSLALGLAVTLFMERKSIGALPLAALFIGGGIGIAFLARELDTLLLFTRLAESAFSDSTREQLFAMALRLFSDNPFFGAGIDPMTSYPHNLLIEAFMAGGLVPGLAFLFIVVYTAQISVRRWHAAGQGSWVFLLYLQYLSAAMVTGSLYGSYAFWVLAVAVVSLKEAGVLRVDVSDLRDSAFRQRRDALATRQVAASTARLR